MPQHLVQGAVDEFEKVRQPRGAGKKNNKKTGAETGPDTAGPSRGRRNTRRGKGNEQAVQHLAAVSGCDSDEDEGEPGSEGEQE